MSGATLATTQHKGLPIGVQVKDGTTGSSLATNWDLSSHPLVINLVCTTNPLGRRVLRPVPRMELT